MSKCAQQLAPGLGAPSCPTAQLAVQSSWLAPGGIRVCDPQKDDLGGAFQAPLPDGHQGGEGEIKRVTCSPCFESLLCAEAWPGIWEPGIVRSDLLNCLMEAQEFIH